MVTIRDGFYQDLLDNLSEGVYFVDTDRRITYWNHAAETLTGRAASEVVGFRCADNIMACVDDKGASLCSTGCSLTSTIADGLPRQVSAYMLHKKGYRTPVIIRVNPIRDNQGHIIGGVESFTDNSPALAAEKRLREMEDMALLDTLTSIGNRRHADMTLEEKFSGLRRYRWPFGVVMCDIDNFKAVNDHYGHNTGDDVLKMVARTLASSVRESDAVFRWGGEEFLAVIANADAVRLNNTAERMCRLMAASALPYNGEMLGVTISAGATLAIAADTPQALVQRADALLYRSKAGGKNRVTAD
jgi:diguanylate cyclase (GGDEF)-like protein/PAS domain S-box-containing protein